MCIRDRGRTCFKPQHAFSSLLTGYAGQSKETRSRNYFDKPRFNNNEAYDDEDNYDVPVDAEEWC